MRGGKRDGAGRPRLAERPVAITVKIAPDVAARFAAYCTAKGISQAKAFARWARRLK